MTTTENNAVTFNVEGISLKSVSLWQITWRRLFRRRSAVVGKVMLGILILIALTAQWIAPYNPLITMIDLKPPERVKARQAPCIHAFGCPQDQPQHIMGIDGNLRDQFSRMLYGARLSLLVGL